MSLYIIGIENTKNNIIECSSNNLFKPVVVVKKKKTGDIRLCIDTRNLNSTTKQKIYIYDCAPNVDSIFIKC